MKRIPKVGDYVTKAGWSAQWYQVLHVDSSNLFLSSVAGRIGYSLHGDWLFRDPEKPVRQRFKIGDRVRLTADNCGQPEWGRAGEEGTVIVADKSCDKVLYLIKLDYSGTYWAGNTTKLELVPPKLDLSKPVQTQDGRPVRILCTDNGNSYPVVGISQFSDLPQSWTREGRARYGVGNDGNLINVPEKPKTATRIVMMQENGNVVVARAGITIKQARKRCPGAIAFREVTITEGEGMS